MTTVVPLHLADVIYPESHPLAGKIGNVLAFAITHPNGLVLIDTGVGEGSAWIDEKYDPKRRDVHDALRAAGLDPNAVSFIVNTHLHFDHCGQNRAFAGVTTVVQRIERDLARQGDHTVTEWVDFPGARYREIDGDTELLPGLWILATPGHTEGHQSVSIDTSEGVELIVGQAAQDARSFATGDADASIARLRALNADRIHFSHDRAVLKRKPNT